MADDIRPQLILKPPSPSVDSLPPATPNLTPQQSSLIKKILSLQSQNHNYQMKLQQLQSTLDNLNSNVNVVSKLKRSRTELITFKKEIQNKNKFLEIKRKELQFEKGKDEAIKGYDQLAEGRYEVLDKKKILEELRKQIKALQTHNKGVEVKLFQNSLKGKLKASEMHISIMHQQLRQNQRLRLKLDKYQSTELKKEREFLRKKNSSAELKSKPSLQLPEIKSKRNLFDKRRSVDDLGKLENERDVYAKFLQVRKPRKQEKLVKQIKDAETKQEEIINKITLSETQIQKLRDKIIQLKSYVTPSKLQQARMAFQKQKESVFKLNTISTNCDLRFKTQRRDWIGKFSGLRFSDSRTIRQQTRLCKIIYSDIGYYQFQYYSINSPKNILTCPLPFETEISGKQTTFRVQHPDYIKDIKLKINITKHIIVELIAESNLGLVGEFPSKNGIGMNTGKLSIEKRKNKTVMEHQLGYVAPDEFTWYTFDIRGNEAPAVMFGSYNVKYNEKKLIQKVCLEGLGVQIIEDYVQEMI